ncbi:helix-turn-helix domain-containing protein [Aeribacillus alveayuensis]|uniref:Sugar diacid utilization regulator n=1 Tax=Aeribacillus alveayuensis TaxID=279215 RepID=A0ABT9VQA4_9BACI|nr:sugar diacid utilization regulator [Bacillus alveayuensis]
MNNTVFESDTLHITENNGEYYVNGERVLLVSISAFGTLKEDIANNIGLERLKGFQIRHGQELGKNDAYKAAKMNFPSIKETIFYGPKMHMMKGHAKVKTKFLKIWDSKNAEKKSVHMEGSWFNSYEAEDHLIRNGKSDTPVCNTLVGYASGYLSVICNQRVIVKETACKAKGDDYCCWVAKSIDICDEETINSELKYYEEDPIVKELGYTYEKLLEERNSLARAASIYKKLAEELLAGNDLESIAKTVYESTGLPIIIENHCFHLLAYAGLTKETFYEKDQSFKEYLNVQIDKDQKSYKPFYSTKKIVTKNHIRLVTPFYVGKKIFGYCSLIYEDAQKEVLKLDYLILERIALVCSLYLLNEKKSFEATERMKGYFLDQILSGKNVPKEEIIQRGRYINLDLNQPYYIVMIKYFHTNQDKNSQDELVFHELFMESISEFFKERKRNLLYSQRSNGVVLLVPESELFKNRVEPFCHELIQYLSKKHKTYKFKAGISLVGNEINEAAKRYEEAVTALRITTFHNKIVSFQSLGMVGALMNGNNVEMVKKTARYLLGELYQCKDSSKNHELLKTLYVYLENGGNLELTAEDLCLSVSGLRYRLQKIKTLLGKDLNDPNFHYQLFLSLQALIMIAEIEV